MELMKSEDQQDKEEANYLKLIKLSISARVLKLHTTCNSSMVMSVYKKKGQIKQFYLFKKNLILKELILK